MVKLRDQATQAAETILTQCLTLPIGAELVVFGDETTIDTATILAEVAVDLKLQPILTYFTTQMQLALGNKELAPPLEETLDEVAATLICLNGTPECLSFRDKIRRTAWNPNCKVAHMPGISQRTLLLADVDYETLSSQCEMLALALAKGHQMEIISWDNKGDEHHLHVPLQPWIRLPIISDGVIQAGSWGNVPSGETYIAPPEGAAEGTIVINGSIPGYRIKSGEEIILHFQAGHVVELTPADSPARQYLQQTQLEFAQSRGDENSSNLAEIGLGANPRVRQLTGAPLLDEKRYGSVHIALGDNTDMGGEVESRIHCDLVCLSPKVLIDGKSVMDNGEIVLEIMEWCEDYQEIKPPNHWHSNLRLKATATQTHIDQQGRLKRLWDTSSGRVCSVPVGDEKTARTVGNLHQTIQKHGQPITISDLIDQKRNFDLSELLQLTYLLKQYNLVSIHNGEDQDWGLKNTDYLFCKL